MIGIDTNVLVRFFAEDDQAQCQRAEGLLQRLSPMEPGFVSLVSLVELAWVLRSQYRLTRTQLIVCIETLLNSPELVLESQTAVVQSLRRFASAKADFADCLIERSCHATGCRETVTFDVDASRFAGMKLL
jgi:predicted nucleic-acid-binding protein